MKRLSSSVLFVMALFTSIFLTACSNKDLYNGGDTENTTTSDFNFATSKSVTLNVTYNTKVAVPFSVYAENPLETTTDESGAVTASLKEDINPLYSGYTENDGTFSSNIELPQYAGKLYVVSPAFYVQNIIEANYANGTASATETAQVASALSRATTGTPTSELQLRKGNTGMGNWYTPLGTFDSYSGMINYALTKDNNNSGLFFDNSVIANFYSDITNALNVNKECPTKYLSSHDLVVDENKEISITMLGGNTCWNSMLGYYYYSGSTPTDASKLHIITLFPNTQDGKWTRGTASPKGIERGTVVQLKYYGKNYDEAAQNVFPAGTKIGFVLASNMWKNNTYYPNNSANNFFSYTTPDLSTSNYYAKKNFKDRTAYYKINTAFINSNGGTLVCFEDHYDDHNCCDVVFALKPKFPDVVELGSSTIKSATNTYAFEDLWPSAGDYDMNDVIVYSDYAKEMKGLSNNSYYITSEVFSFTTDQNHSQQTQLKNGLAVWLNGSYPHATVEFKAAASDTYVPYTSYTTAEENGKTYFYLTDNVKTNAGTYRITISHDYSAQILAQTKQGCFLWRDNNTNGRWEVHIPYELPTSLLSEYYRAKLVSDKPYAALTNNNSVFYPFGICLTGANANNISKLLDASNESKRIDVVYTGYATWVKSNGTTNTDWYIGK